MKGGLNNSITHPGLINAVEGFIFSRLFFFPGRLVEAEEKSFIFHDYLLENFIYIFSVTNIMNLDSILFLKNLVDDPKSFCYEGAISGKLFFQSFTSEGIIL